VGNHVSLYTGFHSHHNILLLYENLFFRQYMKALTDNNP